MVVLNRKAQAELLLVGVRTEVASMSCAKLTYQDDHGRIVAIALHSDLKIKTS